MHPPDTTTPLAPDKSDAGTQLLWYQMAMADAGAGPADKLKLALQHILARKVCTGVILSFTRPSYRAWEQPLAASLISQLVAAGVPYYAEVWLWPEGTEAADPYRPETYHAALATLAELRKRLPGCVGTVLDTEAYLAEPQQRIVWGAEPERVAAAIRTVLDTDGPLSAPPADLLYPGRSTYPPYDSYALYEPLGRRVITELTYYSPTNPPTPWVPPTPHQGRAYFVWPTHSGRYWTPEMLFGAQPWQWEPAVDLVMLYGGGHPWLAAEALRNCWEATDVLLSEGSAETAPRDPLGRIFTNPEVSQVAAMAAAARAARGPPADPAGSGDAATRTPASCL